MKTALRPRAIPMTSASRCTIFRLAALLETYEMRMANLMGARSSEDAQRDAESAMADVRHCAARLPDFSVECLDLFLSHCEVVALLRQRLAQPLESEAQQARAIERRGQASTKLHMRCVQALRSRLH